MYGFKIISSYNKAVSNNVGMIQTANSKRITLQSIKYSGVAHHACSVCRLCTQIWLLSYMKLRWGLPFRLNLTLPTYYEILLTYILFSRVCNVLMSLNHRKQLRKMVINLYTCLTLGFQVVICGKNIINS